MPSSANVQLPYLQPGLLRLPSWIRLRIYELVDACSLDSKDSRTFDLNGHSQSPQSTGLLPSSRTIYDELSCQIFSNNRFVIRYNHRPSSGASEALQPLQRVKNLRPYTVTALRHLKILLDKASCYYREDYADGDWECGQCCIDPNDVHSHQIDPNGARGSTITMNLLEFRIQGHALV